MTTRSLFLVSFLGLTPVLYRLLASAMDLYLKRFCTSGWCFGWWDLRKDATGRFAAALDGDEKRRRHCADAKAGWLFRRALEGAIGKDMLLLSSGKKKQFVDVGWREVVVAGGSSSSSSRRWNFRPSKSFKPTIRSSPSYLPGARAITWPSSCMHVSPGQA